MLTNGYANYAPPATGVDVILAAAATLCGEMSAADIVVAAWRADPVRFGLPGHDHPHSARVICELSARKPIVRSGWLQRIRPSVFVLTDAGYERAAELRGSRIFPRALKKLRPAVVTNNLRKHLADCEYVLRSLTMLTAADRVKVNGLLARLETDV